MTIFLKLQIHAYSPPQGGIIRAKCKPVPNHSRSWNPACCVLFTWLKCGSTNRGYGGNVRGAVVGGRLSQPTPAEEARMASGS